MGAVEAGSVIGDRLIVAVPVRCRVGASLGYEVSQRPERTAAHPRLQPLRAFDTRGVMRGLSGRF